MKLHAISARSIRHIALKSKYAKIHGASFTNTRYFSSGSEPSIPENVVVTGDIPSILVAPELTNQPDHLVISTIEAFHNLSGLPYWGSIIACTVVLRLLLFPVAVSGIRNSTSLAILKPQLEAISAKLKADMNADNDESRLKYQQEMKALFTKYNCNPVRSLTMPLLQVPIFMSFFFGLREMGEFIPAVKEGGALWFTDLSAVDSTYILPVVNAAVVFLLMETSLSSSTMENKKLIQNVFRIFSLSLVPMTMSMPQVCCFC